VARVAADEHGDAQRQLGLELLQAVEQPLALGRAAELEDRLVGERREVQASEASAYGRSNSGA
jgi:hypothetical protein